MNAKQYRARAVAQERALNPRLFRQYARKIVTPRSWALLEQIHAEIHPAPEILPDIVAPLTRFASRRATDQAEAQADFRFALSSATFEHGIGGIDRDEMAGGAEIEPSLVRPVEPVEVNE